MNNETLPGEVVLNSASNNPGQITYVTSGYEMCDAK